MEYRHHYVITISTFLSEVAHGRWGCYLAPHVFLAKKKTPKNLPKLILIRKIGSHVFPCIIRDVIV